MIPRKYQEEESNAILKMLQKYALAYLAWEERTGKSLTGILVVEKSKAEHCVIITKRKAVHGWEETLAKYKPLKRFDVITYGQVKNYAGKPDIAILDEAHNYISGYPKPSKTWQCIRKLVYGLPILYMSATPHAQGYQLLYHQFALSKWSPFNKYSTFYSWFKTYGRLYHIEVYGKDVPQYDKIDEPQVKNMVSHLFNAKTRKELGFTYEPKDTKHFIELSAATKELYNALVKHKIFTFKEITLVADSVIKFRTALHMLEGGTIKTTTSKPPTGDYVLLSKTEKIEDKILWHNYFDLGSREKINYILDTWGDADNLAIMYNYIGEGIILNKLFKKAKILQATSNAEGVELSHVEHLVIYSQDFSTARHTQRRARQASKNRTSPINVHFLLVKKGISEQVYKTVSVNKVNYVDSRFKRETL